MDGKNPQVLALAFKKVKSKIEKIAELNITPDMTEEAIEEKIIALAKLKAENQDLNTTNKEWKDYVKGQRWYVEDLVDFAGLSNQERLDKEYSDTFPELASEQEMLAQLEAMGNVA